MLSLYSKGLAFRAGVMVIVSPVRLVFAIRFPDFINCDSAKSQVFSTSNCFFVPVIANFALEWASFIVKAFNPLGITKAPLCTSSAKVAIQGP